MNWLGRDVEVSESNHLVWLAKRKLRLNYLLIHFPRSELQIYEFYFSYLLENNKFKKLHLPIEWMSLLYDNPDLMFTETLTELRLMNKNTNNQDAPFSLQILMALFPNLEILFCQELNYFQLDLKVSHYNCKQFIFNHINYERTPNFFNRFNEMISNLPNLIQIGSNNKSIYYDNAMLVSISKLKQLVSLAVEINIHVVPGLTSICNLCHKLASLSIDHVLSEPMGTIAINLTFLLTIKSLTKIKIGYPFRGDQIQYLINSPNIVEIKMVCINFTLSECTLLTTALPNVKSITFDGVFVNEDMFILLCINWRHLEEIFLEENETLSDLSIISISDNCLNLKSFYFCDCNEVNIDNGLKLMFQKLKHLTTVILDVVDIHDSVFDTIAAFHHKNLQLTIHNPLKKSLNGFSRMLDVMRRNTIFNGI